MIQLSLVPRPFCYPRMRITEGSGNQTRSNNTFSQEFESMHEHVRSGNEIETTEWLNHHFPLPEVLAVCELPLLLRRKPLAAAIRTESWSPAVSSSGDRSRVFIKRGSAQL